MLFLQHAVRRGALGRLHNTNRKRLVQGPQKAPHAFAVVRVVVNQEQAQLIVGIHFVFPSLVLRSYRDVIIDDHDDRFLACSWHDAGWLAYRALLFWGCEQHVCCAT